MVKLIEGSVVHDKLKKYGNSWIFNFSEDYKDYLGIENPEEVELVVKMEKGKHGNFIGIGVVKKIVEEKE